MSPSAPSDRQAAESSAASQLHRAELALHDAHQTHVDAWIKAATNRLHDAVVRYHQAVERSRAS